MLLLLTVFWFVVVAVVAGALLLLLVVGEEGWEDWTEDSLLVSRAFSSWFSLTNIQLDVQLPLLRSHESTPEKRDVVIYSTCTVAGGY